jgi:hypothetical protein
MPPHYLVSYVVAGLLAVAGLRLFFRMKSEEEDFLYLKGQGQKPQENLKAQENSAPADKKTM